MEKRKVKAKWIRSRGKEDAAEFKLDGKVGIIEMTINQGLEDLI
jgi:hypothetical protein